MTPQKKLLQWYLKNKRALPWRKDQDPYRIWISEMMLQQTQVQTVIPYYNSWMETFPSIEKLAKASLDSVLKAWEGLGYYSRARNIHKTAKIIVEEKGGLFPSSRKEIEKLPGIGPYSAGAILSIAFHLPEAILDGNVIRVLTRFFLIDANVTETETKKKLWRISEDFLLKKNPGDFNQALMELGALICTPTKPLCRLCPIEKECLASSKGNPEKFPLKTKIKYEKLHVSIGLIRKKDKILIQKRPENGRMGGLWEFPGGKVEVNEKPEDALFRELKEELGVEVSLIQPRKKINHAYTKFRVTLHPFDCEIKRGKPKPLSADRLDWVHVASLENYAFPSANKKIIQILMEEQ